jgi:serine/threonine-protein kinase
MQRFGNGKYEVKERLGRGGMAEVYRAHQGNLGRDVAIKVLHPFLADDPEFKTRFQKEARNIAKLRHPNIVQVYDFENDTEQENYYMVMELVDGPTLKELLARYSEQNQLIPINETVRIMREAASALSYAHGMGMIHRDVKPANLMLDSTNRVVLTDFGIAKIVTGVQFTASGGMVGTPAYMSPEQGLGEQGDERSDLYSLGVIFYQMLTGKLPYDGDTPLAVILKHLNDPVKSPRDLRHDIPVELDEIVTQLMAKEPSDRYQTAVDLIADLERFERSNQDMSLDQPGEADYSLQPDTEEHNTKPFPRTSRQERNQTPLTGTKYKPAPGRGEPTNPSRAKSVPGAQDRTKPVLAPSSERERRRPVPIWLWIILSMIIGGGIYAVIWGNGDQLMGLLAAAVSPTASSTIAPTETPPSPSPTLTPSITPTIPTQTPLVVIISPTTPPSPTPSATPTASITPSPIPPSPTLTATPKPPTQTPSITFTPSITPTATTNFSETQTAVANILIIQTATARACDWEYSEVSRRLLVNNVQINDGFVPAGSAFAIEITLRNTGNCPWEVNSTLRYREGEFFNSTQPFIRIQNLVREGTTYVIRFEGTAPMQNGEKVGVWELRTAGNLPIGQEPIRLVVRVFGA